MHYKLVLALFSAATVAAVAGQYVFLEPRLTIKVVPKDDSADAASSGTTTPVAGKDYFADEDCRWYGTAPICEGSCPPGWRFVQREKLNCWTGRKVYCCRQ
ncbi:hypothetical protein CRV24_004808 [Beauveria bassiana]|nr:hypothetical protein CRV24_004808 [Beauveria bassiana]KAH8711444.1 hypothetical protein HC256_008257 [Beauveria bassiana]